MKGRFSDTQDKDQDTSVCTFGIPLPVRTCFQVDKVTCKKTSGSASEHGCVEKTSCCNSFPWFLETGGIFKHPISSNIRMDFQLLANPAQFV